MATSGALRVQLAARQKDITAMIIIFAIVAVFWIACIAFFFTDVLVPYALIRFDEYRWSKLHPGMPLHRRPLH
jgi:lipopolysaccharide export LptBFGC system permease protein LptF